MNLATFASDKKAEETGKWFPLDDARFLIGAHGNKAHRKILARLEKRNRLAVSQKNQDAIDALTIESTAEGLLYGWEGLTTDGKTPFPYSKENAVKLLTNFRQIRDWIMEQALSLQNFTQEADAKEREEIKSGASVAPEVGTK